MPVQPADPANNSSVGENPVAATTPQTAGPAERLTGFIKVPREALFSGFGQVFFLSCVVVVVIVTTFFMGIPGVLKDALVPSATKQESGFVVPVNVAEVEYPQGVPLEKFLENFRLVAKETDNRKRYGYLQENYSILVGFYSATHNPKIRTQLEAYSAYMQSNFQTEYEKNADFYKVPCWDSTCGQVNYPAQVQEIRDLIDASAVLTSTEKESLARQLEVAALSDGNSSQWSAYVNTLSAVKGNYDVTKDPGVLEIYKKLAQFIGDTYKDYKIPPQTRIEGI